MGASMKSSEALLRDDHVMGRTKCKRIRTPEQQAARVAKKLAHDQRNLIASTHINASHGKDTGCMTGQVSCKTPKERRESIVNLCGPAANAGNGPKQGINNVTHQANRRAKAAAIALREKAYNEG